MKTLFLAIFALLSAMPPAYAAEPPWDVSLVKTCDRACLVNTVDRYLDAVLKHDRSGLRLAEDVRFTENTALVNVGEGILWRAKTEATAFKYTIADPVAGQVAMGAVHCGRSDVQFPKCARVQSLRTDHRHVEQRASVEGLYDDLQRSTGHQAVCLHS